MISVEITGSKAFYELCVSFGSDEEGGRRKRRVT